MFRHGFDLPEVSPFHLAQQVYQRELCKRDFFTDFHLHLEGGIIVVTPNLFLMGRAVIKSAPYEEITNPAVQFEKPDAWLVYLAAGHGALKEFFRYEPYPLPYLGWERNNVLRFYPAEAVRRKICS